MASNAIVQVKKVLKSLVLFGIERRGQSRKEQQWCHARALQTVVCRSEDQEYPSQ